MNPAELSVLTRLKEFPAIHGLARFKSPIPRATAVLFAAVSIALCGSAQTYNFSTMAGIGGTAGTIDGTGGGIGFPLFNSPSGVVVNKAGNVYVTDLGNQLIREVTPAGSVNTLAGVVGKNGATDGTGIGASFSSPMGPAIDKAGNLYVADFASHIIRKITPAGVVTTFAGTANTAGTTDGTGTAASFNFPSGIALDGGDNLYVADTANNTIRKITPAGVVSTLAGAAGIADHTDATTGAAARFYYPRSIAIDSSGNLFVADTKNNTIRKIKSTGEVTTFAGAAGTFGSTDGVGLAARFNFPNSITIDASGNLYVADQLNNAVRKITPDGTVTTLAGLPGSKGAVDATGSAALFNAPCSVSADGSGNIYVADYNNQLIRKISPAGAVTTVAGAAGVLGALDGLGYNLTPTLFYNPSSTAVDGAGNVYVADSASGVIRKITPAGVTSTLAGTPSSVGQVDGTGSAATFSAPSGVASDPAGNVYVADTANHLIRLVTPAGVVTTFAGTPGTTPVAGSTDGVGKAASFNFPTGIAYGPGGTLYVADYENHVIRKITSDGTVSTLAGTAGSKGSADGTGGSARFSFPRSVAVDNAGTVYVADSGNNTIRTISPGGTVQTLAGSAGASGSADGIGGSARFNGPSGIAVDSASHVFVSDSTNSTIRMVTVSGVVTTIGGAAGNASNVDGAGTAARFDHPAGLSVDAAGTLYIADMRNQTIRKGSTTSSSSPGPGGPIGTGGTGGTGGGTGPAGINGNGGTGGSGGANTGAGFLLKPVGLANNPAGGVYVADSANNSIKAIAASDGTITVLAGKDGTAGSADGTGSAASFNNPTGMAVDSAGNVYVCDTNNATIRKVTSAGVVTTLAGSASSRGNQDGTGSAASFMSPTGIAMNSAGDLFVTDSTNDTIRKVTTAGVVTTFAGAAKSVGDVDGVGTAARFNNPTGVTMITNFLYVADTNNNTIRGIYTVDIPASGTAAAIPAATVKTIAGSPGISGAFDGIDAYALFNLPTGLSADSSGNVYVADTGNSSIRRVNGGRTVTIAGIAGITGYRDGTFIAALFNQPQGVLVSSSIFVADTGNSLLRGIGNSAVFTPNLKNPTTTTPPPSTSGSGGGGSMEPWFVTVLLASAVAMKSRRRVLKA